MDEVRSSRMRERRYKRSADLGDGRGLSERGEGGITRVVSPDEDADYRTAKYISQATRESITMGTNGFIPPKPLQLEQPHQQIVKPAERGSKGRKAKKGSSDQGKLGYAQTDAINRRAMVVVGDKATALARGAGAGRDLASEQSEDPLVAQELSRKAKKALELMEWAEVAQTEISGAAKAQLLQHLKERTKRAFREASILRDKLEKAEAAVIGGKKKRDMDIAEREAQLRLCEERIRELEAEGTYQHHHLERSVSEATRLGNELKRTQESLLLLSAWDEEKVELEAEVASLKAQLSAATEEGEKRLEQAQRDFDIASAKAGTKAQLLLARNVEKIRLELEKGLSEEFKSLRREVAVLCQERADKDMEMNRIMKNAARLERDLRETRAQVADERRMHDRTIRSKKRAEAVISNLQAQLTLALGPASGRVYCPSNASLSPHRPVKQWNSPRPPAPVRGKLLIRECDNGGAGGKGDGGLIEVLPGGGRRVCKVPALLVPARKRLEQWEGEEKVVESEKEHVETTAGTGDAAAGGPMQASEYGRSRKRPTCRNDARVGKGGDHVTGETSVGSCDGARTEWGSAGVEIDGGDGGCGRDRGGEEGNGIPGLIVCGTGSEISQVDVWGMLDNYVHRRSEVARAKLHLGVIEAMHKHLEKSQARGGKPTSSCSSTPVQYDARGRHCVRMGSNSCRIADEKVWRAFRRKSSWRKFRPDEACTNGRGKVPSNGRRPAHQKTAVTSAGKPRVYSKPHPMPRCKRDGSSSNMPQMTAVCRWEECGTEERHGTIGRTSHPTVSGDHGRGRDGGNERPQGPQHTTASNNNNNSGRHDHADGNEARRGGRLSSPSSRNPKGGRGHLYLPASGDCGGSAHDQHREDTSTVTGVIVRSPSLTSVATETVITSVARFDEGPAAAGKGKPKGRSTLCPRRSRGTPFRRPVHHKARSGSKAAAGIGFGRLKELSNWIETNTNLVNVSAW